MHLRAKCLACAITAAAMSLVVLSAQAGVVLRLKAGEQNLSSKLQTLASQELKSQFVGSREYVVQYRGPISQADKSLLKKNGFKLLSYIPDDALVVYGDGARLAQLAKTSASVRAVGRFEPDWKVSGDLLPESVFTRELRVRVHIRMAHKDFTKNVEGVLRNSKDVEVRLVGEKVIVADVPRTDISGLAVLPGVEWIEPLPDVHHMDFDPGVKVMDNKPRKSETGYESGTKIMNLDAAWARGFKGSGQTAAMADTGLDSGDLGSLHKDLSATTDAYSATFLPFTWADTNGHGTHVAGSVIGNGSMSNGLIKGGAHEAKFVAQAVMLPFIGILDPTALQDPNKLVGGAYDKGARVHTNSWGADAKGAYDAMAASFDEYMWNNQDILVVFANGNSGADANSDGRVDEGSVGSPASAKNVLSVGASENLISEGGIQKPVNQTKVAEAFRAEPIASDVMSNNPNGMAMFSSRGPTADGRIKPDVVAPGTNIVSARSSAIQPSENDPGVLWGEYDQNYLYCGGTSMATPLAAGAATVARQFLTQSLGVSNPSGAMVKATLMHTAFDMYPGQYGTGPTQEFPTPRPNNHEGYGRVDMDKLTSLGRETVVVDEKAGVGLNEEKTFSLTALNGVTVTLAYTDAPGSANAQKALVNDIDLVVTTPSGQVLTKNDRTNNVELIETKSGGKGLYTITVKGVNIPNGKAGKQPFALVATPN